MMLRYSFGMNTQADLIERAVSDVLAKNIRTADILAPGGTPVGTTEMGDAILSNLATLAANQKVA